MREVLRIHPAPCIFVALSCLGRLNAKAAFDKHHKLQSGYRGRDVAKRALIRRQASNASRDDEDAAVKVAAVATCDLAYGDIYYIFETTHSQPTYMEVHGYAGEGYGVSTAAKTSGDFNGMWTMESVDAESGCVRANAKFYLRETTHSAPGYAEVHGSVGEGYGVSTAEKTSGDFNGEWILEPMGDEAGCLKTMTNMYIRETTHSAPTYMEVHGSVGEGYGVSTADTSSGDFNGQWKFEPVVSCTSAPTTQPTEADASSAQSSESSAHCAGGDFNSRRFLYLMAAVSVSYH